MNDSDVQIGQLIIRINPNDCDAPTYKNQIFRIKSIDSMYGRVTVENTDPNVSHYYYRLITSRLNDFFKRWCLVPSPAEVLKDILK